MKARFEIDGVVERCKPVTEGVELTITIDETLPHPERSAFRVLVCHGPFIRAALARLDRHWRVSLTGSILPTPVERNGRRLQCVQLRVGAWDLFDPH